MAKILHVVLDADLRPRQRGLFKQALAAGLSKNANLNPGDILVFVNRKRDKIAVLGFTTEDESLGVMGYYKSPHGRAPLEAIQYIPESFGGTYFNMTAAIKKSLEGALRS